jgi:hypothetical protein
MSTRKYDCEQCGRVEEGPVVGKAAGVSTGAGTSIGPLPSGWERYRWSDPFSPVWCGQCVGQLLDDIAAAMMPVLVGSR